MVTKPVIFLSSPFYNDSLFVMHKNVEFVRDLARFLITKDFILIVPHLQNFEMMGPDLPEQLFVNNGIELLERVDGLILAGKWPRSKGCKQEREYAEEIELPMFEFSYDYEDLDGMLISFFERCLLYRREMNIVWSVRKEILSPTKEEILENFRKEPEISAMREELEMEEEEDFKL